MGQASSEDTPRRGSKFWPQWSVPYAVAPPMGSNLYRTRGESKGYWGCLANGLLGLPGQWAAGTAWPMGVNLLTDKRETTFLFTVIIAHTIMFCYFSICPE